MAQNSTVCKAQSQNHIRETVRVWLNTGGRERLREASELAQETSEKFARSTRVRPETLTDPVTL